MAISRKSIFIFLNLFILPMFIFAVIPIARWDVVPHQRIEKNFDAGVVAFSKAGVLDVSFDVSGQGYAGPSTQKVFSMELNTRTDVWEYFITLDPSDFTGSGKISIVATVTGKDGGVKELDPLILIVDGAGTLEAYEVWCDNHNGNDSTGLVGNPERPFETILAAINAVQALSNESKCDGAKIYLEEGAWTLGTSYTYSTLTVDEWIYFTKAPGASKENVIIDTGGTAHGTTWGCFKDLTISNKVTKNRITWHSPSNLWCDNVDIIGFNRTVTDSSPIRRDGVSRSDYPCWFTDCYVYNVDMAFREAYFCRGCDIEHIANDAFQNVECVINCTVDDIDPEDTYNHADVYQMWRYDKDNFIIYGLHATNCHYQGFYIDNNIDHTSNTNIAFVNVLIEMRGPGRYDFDNSTQKIILDAGGMVGNWDHVLLWNCTFLGGWFYYMGSGWTNSSMIGCLFDEWLDFSESDYVDPDWTLPGNSEGNVFLNNHFQYSAVTGEGIGSDKRPHYRAKSPDSDPDVSQSIGDPEIITSTDDIKYIGMPKSDTSPLVDRLPLNYFPVDALGKLRDSLPDIGAIEYNFWSGRQSVKPSGIKVIY